jgi:hypothetical protein
VRLNLHKSIFDEQHHIELNDILSEAYKKRISIHIEDIDSYSEWVSLRPKSEQSKWTLVIKTSANLHMTAKISCIFQIREDIETNWEADIPIAKVEDLDYLLKLPLTIALENGRNDRNFLLSVCKSGLRERLMELEKQQSLAFDGAGGITELINYMKGKYVSHPANRHKYWLLFDGDAPVPSALAQPATALIDLCLENRFKNYHCLVRRAIENYLPISDSADIQELYSLFNTDNDELKEQLESFGALSDEQRYHYHMKKGLENTSCKDSKLYDSIDSKTKKLIGKGFKKIRIDSIYDFGVNASFEDFEQLHQLLKKEGAPVELSAFLKQLDFNTRKTK